MSERRQARVQVSLLMIRQLLGLADDVEILDVLERTNADRMVGSVSFVVQSPRLRPIAELDNLPDVHAVCHEGVVKVRAPRGHDEMRYQRLETVLEYYDKAKP